MNRPAFLFIFAAFAFTSLQLAAAQDAANDELVTMVVELLSDADADMRALALEKIRSDAPGKAATAQFAGQLSKLTPDAQVGLLSALAQRGDTAAKSAVVELLGTTKETNVSQAAIETIGFLGDVSDAPTLLKLLTSGGAPQRQAARGALVRLQGETIAATIAESIKSVDPGVQATLIGVLAQRRALDTIPTLLAAAVAKNPIVRAAAVAALSELASAEHLSDMLRAVLAAERGREQETAEKAVMTVCSRIEDTRQRRKQLVTAMHSFSTADQLTLLPTAGRVGGREVLKHVNAAIASSDPLRHDTGIRALCNWPDASVAPELIKLIQSDRHNEHRVSATRALARIAPLSDGRADEEKLQLLKQVIALSTRDSERLLALSRAAAIRTPECLRFLLPYTDQSEYAEAACLAIVDLAHHRSLREPNQVEFEAALNKVIATSKNATTIDRARRYKKGETWVRPK